jgi:hypothetical protein
MADLRRDRRTFRVHGVGQPAQSRHGRLTQEDLVTMRAALRGDGQVGDGGHADAAARQA